MAQLRAVIAELRSMDNTKITGVLKANLAASARPFAPAVRAAILNTPAYGPKHTGLRVRIAGCVQTWAEINGPQVSVGVEVNSSRMPPGQYSLPLMLEGAKRWRHPVYGDDLRWVGQNSYPYFWQATSGFGFAGQRAVQRACDEIAAKLNAG